MDDKDLTCDESVPVKFGTCEIWNVRSIERSQNMCFLGILTLKFKKISQTLTRLRITIKIINSIEQINIFTHFML